MWYHACGVMDFNLSPKGTPQLFTLLYSLATEGKTPHSSAFRETADASSPFRGAYKEYPPFSPKADSPFRQGGL